MASCAKMLHAAVVSIIAQCGLGARRAEQLKTLLHTVTAAVVAQPNRRLEANHMADVLQFAVYAAYAGRLETAFLTDEVGSANAVLRCPALPPASPPGAASQTDTAAASAAPQQPTKVRSSKQHCGQRRWIVCLWHQLVSAPLSLLGSTPQYSSDCTLRAGLGISFLTNIDNGLTPLVSLPHSLLRHAHSCQGSCMLEHVCISGKKPMYSW